MTDPASPFNFDAFRTAFAAKDAARWTAFYADDAEWVEYRHADPPRSPHVMRGRDEIAEFVSRVCTSRVTLVITDEIVGPSRAAFCLTCALSDGRRIIEHIIIHYAGGRITRQVDVEAWD